MVDDFAASGPYDRHFTLDAATGEIAFGPAVRQPDGAVRQYGAVPLKGARSGPRRLPHRRRPLRQCRPRRHPGPAQLDPVRLAGGEPGGRARRCGRRDGGGGQGPRADRAARPGPRRDRPRLRGAHPPRRPRDRPHRLPGGGRRESGADAVRVLVVPQAVPDLGGRLRFEQLVPGDELLGRITAYLDERRPIGTRLAVGPPFYQGVTAVHPARLPRRRGRPRTRRGPQRALLLPRPADRRPDGTAGPSAARCTRARCSRCCSACRVWSWSTRCCCTRPTR